MDDNNQPTTPAQGGGVMDVQPPKTAPQIVSGDPVPEAEAGSVITPATETPTSDPVMTTPPPVNEEAPAEPANAPEAVQEAPTDTSTPTDADNKEVPASSDSNPMAIANQPAPKKKSGAPVIVIVVAVLVALGLCALVISIYMKSKNDTADKKATTSQATVNKATPEEVDKVAAETDTALSQLDDAKDFADTDLADSTLGL